MNMLFIGIVIILVLIVVGLFAFRRYKSSHLDKVHFTKSWQELQKNCKSRKTWPLAIVDADNLLNEALKQHRYKGKTTGERLVAAQHTLSANEAVWFGHKLRNRITNEDVRKLKKQDILDALNGFRQALKDLGAL
jgi:hypothetical protein